jgi:aspartyl protease family protein
MQTLELADWQQMALYAVIAAIALLLLQRIPYVGRIIKGAVSVGLLALCLFLLVQQAPFQPGLERIVGRIGLDPQEVVGSETRIRMSSDGHFWAKSEINGVERRMLIDSGATVTAVSQETAASAAIGKSADMVPVVLRTANGMTSAQTGTIGELRVGNIIAHNIKVVSSPALGDLNVLGMNFLSRLASWRVEGRTLILVPSHPQPGPHVE